MERRRGAAPAAAGRAQPGGPCRGRPHTAQPGVAQRWSAAAPPSVAGLTFVNWNEPVGCGGVAVFPGDWIVADDDGAVVIPAAFIEEAVANAPEQERLEAWIMEEVEKGASLPGLYPPNAENKARYEKAKTK